LIGEQLVTAVILAFICRLALALFKDGFEKNTDDWIIEDNNELNKTVFFFSFR
jgi:hypothetical protein